MNLHTNEGDDSKSFTLYGIGRKQMHSCENTSTVFTAAHKKRGKVSVKGLKSPYSYKKTECRTGGENNVSSDPKRFVLAIRFIIFFPEP